MAVLKKMRNSTRSKFNYALTAPEKLHVLPQHERCVVQTESSFIVFTKRLRFKFEEEYQLKDERR